MRMRGRAYASSAYEYLSSSIGLPFLTAHAYLTDFPYRGLLRKGSNVCSDATRT